MAVTKPRYIAIHAANGECTEVHETIEDLENDLKDGNWIHDEGEQNFQIFEVGNEIQFEVVTKLRLTLQEKK